MKSSKSVLVKISSRPSGLAGSTLSKIAGATIQALDLELPEGWAPDGLVQFLSTDYKFAVSFAILVIVLLNALLGAVQEYRAERAVAAALQGSCQVPLAVYAELGGASLQLTGMVGMPDGSRLLRAQSSGEPSEMGRVADEVARALLDQGAAQIIAALT